jgi:hypothetical protein
MGGYIPPTRYWLNYNCLGWGRERHSFLIIAKRPTTRIITTEIPCQYLRHKKCELLQKSLRCSVRHCHQRLTEPLIKWQNATNNPKRLPSPLPSCHKKPARRCLNHEGPWPNRAERNPAAALISLSDLPKGEPTLRQRSAQYRSKCQRSWPPQ